MFDTLRLLTHGLLGIPRWLNIGGKQMCMQTLIIDTSPSILNEIESDGIRAANRKELELFARIYKPAKGILVVHAVDFESTDSIFGPIAKLYATKGAKVEHIGQNFVFGVPRGTIFLWVKEDVPSAKVV